MEFGLSPIPGFLFLCPFLRFGSARTQFPAAPNFFIFSPSSSGVSAALLFLPSCSFSFPSCSFSFWAAVFLLRCPVPAAFFLCLLSSPPFPCALFLHALFLHALFLHALFPHALFPARLFFAPPFPRALFPARSLSRAPLPARLFFAPPFPRALFPARSLSRAPLPARLFLHALFSRVSHLPSPPTLFPA